MGEPYPVRREAAPAPVLSSFPETNVRTYVVGPDGRDGLFFLGIDADALLTTVAARATLGAPYHWSRMAVEDGAETAEWRYRCARRADPDVGHDLTVRVTQRPVDTGPGSLAGWLVGRWRAWTVLPIGALAAVPVEHRPWELVDAEVGELWASVLDAAGVPGLGRPAHVHAAVGEYDVALGLPQRGQGGDQAAA